MTVAPNILDRYGPLPWAGYLVTEDERCKRHLDEPQSWCLECRAIREGRVQAAKAADR